MSFLKKSTYSIKNATRSVSSRRVKGDVTIPPAKRIGEAWKEDRGTMKTVFEALQPKNPWFGPDVVRMLQTPIDISPSNMKKWFEEREEEQEEVSQSFIQERYDILGADLAAAHFVVHRGGAVRLYNQKEWVRAKESGEYTLPVRNVKGLYLDSIDCRGFQLRSTGLENILDLPKLRWLCLADQTLIDDFTLDLISGSYGETLQYLDISNCPRISHRGLYCFYRFQKLETLVVKNTAITDEFKLACVMLEDIRPKLNIQGVDFPTIPSEQEKGTEA